MPQSLVFTDITNKVKSFLSQCDRKIGIGNVAEIPWRPDSGNNAETNRRLLDIDVSDNYQMVAEYKFQFTDDSTFILWRIYPDIVNLGEGFIDEQFISSDEFITIETDYWSGNSATAGDLFYMKINTDLSETNFQNIVSEYMRYVESRLSKKITLDLPYSTDTKDVDGTIFEIIKFGSSYRTYPKDANVNNRDWDTKAENLIQMILDGEIQLDTEEDDETEALLYWEGGTAIYNKKGVEGIGDGEIDV